MALLYERARRLCAPFMLCIATIATAVPAAAQTAFDVTGTVTADDGTPLAGASVTLSGRVGATTARTDDRGHFSLRTVAGTYSVRAEAPGYAPLSQQTVTIAGAGVSLALVLRRRRRTRLRSSATSAHRPVRRFRPRPHRA